jgi:hypothetical protein
MVELPTEQDPRLVSVFQAGRVWNGVTTTTDGRVFVLSFPPLVEWRQESMVCSHDLRGRHRAARVSLVACPADS